MKDAYMETFWKGYRAAAAYWAEYGQQATVDEYWYGLQGCSPAYCRGWLKFINRKIKR